MSSEPQMSRSGEVTSRWLIPTLLGLALAGWLVAWGGAFPAIMSPDSIDQWTQVVTGKFSDWHPLAHTLLVSAATQIWPTPAAMIALHLVLMTLLLRAVLQELARLGCGRVTLLLTGLFYALHPIHGRMISTLWKDVPFALAITAFTLILIRLCREPGRLELPAMAGLLACGTAITLLRHQGITVAALSLLGVVIAFPTKRKRGVAILLVLLTIAVAWRATVRQGLGLTGSPITEALAIPLQQAVTIVSNQGMVTPDQRHLLEIVVPWEKWRHQPSRVSVDWLKFDPTFSAESIRQRPAVYLGLWIGLMRQNPGLAARGWLRQTMILWHPGQNATGVDTSGITRNSLGLQPAPWSDSLARLSDWLGETMLHAPLSWSVRPSWWHTVLLIAGVLACRRSGWRGVVPFLPVTVLSLTLMALIPVPDFRYFYPALLTAPPLLAYALLGLRQEQPSAIVPSAPALPTACL